MDAKGAESVIDALDLDIKDGEFLVLLGSSGSGKITAPRMLVGLEPLDGDPIEIVGRDVRDMQPKDRGIAVLHVPKSGRRSRAPRGGRHPHHQNSSRHHRWPDTVLRWPSRCSVTISTAASRSAAASRSGPGLTLK